MEEVDKIYKVTSEGAQICLLLTTRYKFARISVTSRVDIDYATSY